MFNHYTPQSDGSYQRSSRPEPARRSGVPQMNIPSSPRKPPVQEPQQPCVQPPGVPEGIGAFLLGLLPRRPDTADFLVILLVLLMHREDGSSPLLTLALYFLL